MNPIEQFEDFTRTHLEWDELTETQQLDEMKEYTRLKRLSEKYRIEKEEERRILNEQSEQIRKDAIQTYILSLGYVGDGSLVDWIKLYNRKEIFGDLYESIATAKYEESNDKLNDFMQEFLRYN